MMMAVKTPISVVVRTERGLTIAGTRKTIYQVMDCIKEGWPTRLIQCWLDLTDEQIAGVMDYIETNRADVEAEYEQVLSEAEENRQYWEERNREHFARVAALPPDPRLAEARKKHEALRIKLGLA